MHAGHAETQTPGERNGSKSGRAGGSPIDLYECSDFMTDPLTSRYNNYYPYNDYLYCS